MKQYEAEQSPEILEKLLQLSAQWAAEQNCYGYYPNTEADIEGKRIFLAEDEDGIEAYLLGKLETAKNMKPSCRREHGTLKIITFLPIDELINHINVLILNI